MGSFIGRKAGICVTLDAFGTLYRPRKPIGAQYLEVAHRCGLDLKFNASEMQSSFRQAFKEQYAEHPNYGKATGMKAEEWWDDVVCKTFLPHLEHREVPVTLPLALYRHFSTGAAYELFPDVKPFLRSMRVLRERYSDHTGPIVMVGVLSNSDDRVRGILENLGIRCSSAVIVEPKLQELSSTTANPGGGTYRPEDEISFVVTSHQGGYEKPDGRLFLDAEMLATSVSGARYYYHTFDTRKARKPRAGELHWDEYLKVAASKLAMVHVGDDLKKDYMGAKASGWEALHLCRQIKPADKKGHQISNLLELAVIVQTIARLKFEDRKK